MTAFQTLASLADLTADDINYQVTGMVVVFACLGFLCILLTISGNVAQKLDAARKAKADAARAAAAAAAPAPVAAAAPAAQPAANTLSPQMIAVIAAAVYSVEGREARILNIKPASIEYGRGGRNAIMNSHFPVRG